MVVRINDYKYNKWDSGFQYKDKIVLCNQLYDGWDYNLLAVRSEECFRYKDKIVICNRLYDGWN